MAAIDTNRLIVDRQRLGGRLTHVFAVFATWNDARMTRKVLKQLSDRELDDIGLIRADIDRIG